MAATNQEMATLLARLRRETSNQREMVEFLDELEARIQAGEPKIRAFLTALESEYACPIEFGFPENPVKIVSQEGNSELNENEFYERATLQQQTESPTTRQRIIRIVDAKKEFYDSICQKIKDFLGPDLEAKKSSQCQFEIGQIRQQTESLNTHMNRLLDDIQGFPLPTLRDSLEDLHSKFQKLLSDSSLINPKLTNLGLRIPVGNRILAKQQQELFGLLSTLQSTLKAAMNIVKSSPKQSSLSSSSVNQAKPVAQSQRGQSSAQSQWAPSQAIPQPVNGFPVIPAHGYPIQPSHQSPTAPLLPPTHVTSLSQHSLSSSPAISSTSTLLRAPQQYPHQPVTAQSQLGSAPHLQTSAEAQVQLLNLRHQLITLILENNASLKEFFRVEINDGQLAIRESSVVSLTQAEYQSRHATLAAALNKHMPGITWTLDTTLVVNPSNHLYARVIRMNLAFPSQAAAVQPQYPAVQPQHRPSSPTFFPPAAQPQHYGAGNYFSSLAQPQQAAQNGNPYSHSFSPNGSPR